ncbi:putative fungal specific transcription factor [Lyophyllum shimeji]|uniref:Fungal specific transcription factor n=1 Tax=Lyophyllum shimeji TaxID=47721 RepID=A0A9P3PIC7_LYOSH|nr:putative fungal specific transcription factor [Lyophyllum shimeji]
MDPSGSVAGPQNLQADAKLEQRDVKPVVKTLNRVPRACNACRKQKMRCEGADNPPCKRCRNTNLECLFEKPSREATLTGEAGLERIRSLEAHVADIRHTQTVISNTLSELVAHLRGRALSARSPASYSQSFQQPSPNVNSPSMSTPTSSHQHILEMHPSPPGGPHAFPSSHQGSSIAPPGQPSPAGEFHPPPLTSPYANNQGAQAYKHGSAPPGPVLPPFSSISTMGPPSSQSNVSSLRYQAPDNAHPRSMSRNQVTGSKRQASSNVTSANSSDLDDDDNGELPASGLVAPWEVLRGLADVAIERAAKENGDSSGPHSRARTPSPDRQGRPLKRRKIRHKLHRSLTFPDVVTKNIISESEARELFKIFYRGCSTFLPVFDSNNDTFDALHERSPFAVDCICMVAARTRDGGGPSSETYIKILEEVQSISCATLFAPVMRSEAVQSMILVSGWSDNGWLSGGHAVRMAMELSMHKAWPRLLRRMKANKADAVEDRDLVIASRTWFCLYLFEHQLSYGTGRPAVLKDDESIQECRLLLSHPLAIEDDMRLVSTVELMAIRERVHNDMSPIEGPVREEHFARLREADGEFSNWYKIWDHAFSQKYEDATFYRQSLQIQHLHAELFHNATALRGINGPDDVQNMPAVQKHLALRSVQIARQGLDITVNSPAYREGMKYAVHYTHATATFAASFLLRLARLFPNDCNISEIRTQVERLANLMAEVPGKRYALTLQLMLKRSMKRKAGSMSRSPKTSREPHRPMAMVVDRSSGAIPSAGQVPLQRHQEPYSPQYDTSFSGLDQMHHIVPGGVPHQQHQSQHHHQQQQMHHPQHYQHATDAEHIWRGFEMTANEQLPVWISDQSLGGSSFVQSGMDAFLLPNDYMPPAPQIW